MSDGRGAPTAKWPTLPPHLDDDAGKKDAPPKASLLVRRPEVPEVEIQVDKDGFIIGRQPSEVDLVLDDDLVSRQHARLDVDARGYFRLQDLGSKNGIKFAGRTVRRLNLMDGDEFQIGKASFVFKAELKRFQGLPAPTREPPPRADSVFGEVKVPTPKSDASMLADAEDVGWDPSRAQPSAAPMPAEEPPAEDDA